MFNRYTVLCLLFVLTAFSSGICQSAGNAATGSKSVRVTTKTVFFKPEQLVNELSKRKEIHDWGWRFVESQGEREADINIELDHTLFTYKFSFKTIDRSGRIIATGNVTVFDGNLGAAKMADRVIEEFKTLGAPKDAVAGDVSPNNGGVDARTPQKSAAEIRKLLKASRSGGATAEEAAKSLRELDKSYLPVLRTILSKGKACEQVDVASLYLELNDNDNRDIIPALVEITTGGNLLSLFNLQKEFMCRRRAAYLLPFSAEGIRALTKLLNDGDTWEKQTAIFAFDDFTEVYDYDNPAMDEAIGDAIPVMGKGVKAKDAVLSEMSDEVLGQIFRRSPPKLKALASKYYED